MSTHADFLPSHAFSPQPVPAVGAGSVIAYYREATMDYRFWSPDNLNMHFGLGSLRHLFDREAMLEDMNARVFERLAVEDRPGASVVDLGCGTGATMRHGATRTSHTRFTGVTLSPEHVRRARAMNPLDSGSNRLEVACADFTATALGTAAFDGACAVESACHARPAYRRRLSAPSSCRGP